MDLLHLSRKTIMLFGIGAVVIQPTPLKAADIPVLTPCDVIVRLAKLNNAFIAVRGVRYQTQHDGILVHEGSRVIPAECRAWPAAVKLVGPSPDPKSEGYASFSVDAKLELALRALYQKLRQDGDRQEIVATYIGLLKTRPRFRMMHGDHFVFHGNGFGHFSLFPAVLVVKEVRDVVLRDIERPTTPVDLSGLLSPQH